MTTITLTLTLTRTESLLTAEERDELYHAWRERFAQRNTSARDILMYALLRGKDARRGFTPITNPTKLANGQRAWEGYRGALVGLDKECNTSAAGRNMVARLQAFLPSAEPQRLDELRQAIGLMTAQLRKEA